MNKGKRFLYLIFVAPLLFSFQNCGEGFNANQRGLASTHTSDILDKVEASSKARSGDRIYIATAFADVFLPVGQSISDATALSRAGGVTAKHFLGFISSNYTAADKPITQTLIDRVLKNLKEFHGACTYISKDMTCAGFGDTNGRRRQAEKSSVAPSSVTKEGYRLSVCDRILSFDRAVENVVFNTTGNRKTKLKPEHIALVYDLFYPAQSMSSEAYEAIAELVDEAVENKETNLDTWRLMITPICHSSGWQIP